MKNKLKTRCYFASLLALIPVVNDANGQNKTRQTEKPNILWLSCEDISPNLSFYGDSTAKTPVLDKLASESIVFTHAFATVGVSAPSRSSIITGMYPASIGTLHMRTGSDVGGWGKRTYDKTFGTKEVILDIEGKPIRQYSAVIPEGIKCFTEYLREAGYYCTNNSKTDYQFAAPVTAWDANDNNAHWKNRPEEKPFFAVFNHGITHESQIWKNARLPLTVSPDSVPLPAYFPDNPVVRQDMARNYSNIELLDKQIGEKLQQLDEAGLMENTIIFFFSDHGGPLPRGKRAIYDSGLRVPMMIRFPKSMYAGYTNEMISFVDLAPTILSLAGIKPPEYMQGQAFLGQYKTGNKRRYIYGSGDRFDEFTDRVRSVRDERYIYVKNYHTKLPYYKDISYRKQIPMMMELLRLRNAGDLEGASKLWFRETKVTEELYDCKTDQDNVIDLAQKPEYSEKLAELRNALNNWQEEIKDVGNIPEAQLIESMWHNFVQPQTEKPVLKESKGTITATCTTKGSSIGYVIADKEFKPAVNSGWTLYTSPIKAKKGKYLYVMSNRIGFKDSEVISLRIK